ncbi:hypothetical protein OAJ78_05425 [Gammaproteobacteria bacterium]|nr:hypothetical protein [Gammaproteobacteria bacterium]
MAAKITTVPKNIATDFNIDTKFYKKYVSVKGIPIIAPRRVNNRALLKTGHLIQRVLAPKKMGNRLAGYLTKYRNRIAIVPRGKDFSHMPELRGDKKWNKFAGIHCCAKTVLNEAWWRWDEFYRTGFTKEANALELGWPMDGHWSGSTLTHELAHLIDFTGFFHEMPAVRRDIERAYAKAIKAGKYKGAYAATNVWEYWAEGTEVWFATKFRDSKLKYTYITNRKELKKYDPDLAKILKKIYGNGRWRFKYGKTPSRLRLSSAFGGSVKKAAVSNMFMVGENLDQEVFRHSASFSFDDYVYMNAVTSLGDAIQLGFKESTPAENINMGGHVALGFERGEFRYSVAVDDTLLGTRGEGWLGYKDASSLYLGLSRDWTMSNKWQVSGDLIYGLGQARSNKESILQDFTRIHSLGLDVVATRKLNAADTLNLSLSAPLRVESGAVTIKSPYDAERVNLSPSGRQVDVGVSFQHQIDAQRSVSAGITYINDYHHARDVTHGQVMLNYRGSF